MNDLTVNSNTMTSKELLEIVNTEFRNEWLSKGSVGECRVIKLFTLHRDIKRLFGDDLANTNLVSSTRSNGQVEFYMIPEAESMAIMARYFIQYLMKLSEFWVTKKNESQLPNFNNPAIAARAWADQVEQKQIALNTISEQKLKLEEQQPKVEMYNQFFDSNGLMSFLEYSKTIYDVTKMGRNKLMHDLRNRNILLKTSNLPSQKYIDNGSFKVFYNSFNKPSAKLTRKGVEFLNSIYLKDIVDERYNLFNLLDNDNI